MKDMLSAAKRGDREMVDALIKRTEFADYAHYFGITYSPDPLAAKEWATPYQQWLGENEDHLRELLETLAKDEDGNILVRKANDDPAPGRGFEWGMLHYARIPIDVYRVTLVFTCLMVRGNPSDISYTPTECFDGTVLFHLPPLERTNRIPAL